MRACAQTRKGSPVGRAIQGGPLDGAERARELKAVNLKQPTNQPAGRPANSSNNNNRGKLFRQTKREPPSGRVTCQAKINKRAARHVTRPEGKTKVISTNLQLNQVSSLDWRRDCLLAGLFVCGRLACCCCCCCFVPKLGHNLSGAKFGPAFGGSNWFVLNLHTSN